MTTTDSRHGLPRRSGLSLQVSALRTWLSKWIRYSPTRIKQAIIEDWQGSRVLSYGLALALVSSVVTATFYLNHPQVEINDDTPSYLRSTQDILAHGQFANAMRVPGFPSFMALIFLLVGKQSLFAVSLVEAALFVIAALEIYGITWLVFRRAWLSLLVGLMVGCNTYLLAFVKPVTVEGISLWLVTTLAFVSVIFVQTLKLRHFWLVAILTLATFMTRPEWMYVPVPLFAYLLFVAARRGWFRRLFPHALIAIALLYGVLGLYIYDNAIQNGYAGVSYIQDVNLLGKVMQYRMQNEASPQYAAETQKINAMLAQKPNATPYELAAKYPEFKENKWMLSGDYATPIVKQHLPEFLLKTVPVFFTSSNHLYAFSGIKQDGHFAPVLLLIQIFSAGLQRSFRLFPLFALIWIGLLLWWRTRRLRGVEIMGAVVLLVLYDLWMTSLGSYSDYMRFHVPFDPLVTLVIWGSVLYGAVLCEPYILRGFVLTWLIRLWRRIGWAWGGLVTGIVLVNAVVSALINGPAGLVHLATWPLVVLGQARPLVTMCLLALPVLLTFFAYRAYAHTRTQATVPEHLPDADRLVRDSGSPGMDQVEANHAAPH